MVWVYSKKNGYGEKKKREKLTKTHEGSEKLRNFTIIQGGGRSSCRTMIKRKGKERGGLRQGQVVQQTDPGTSAIIRGKTGGGEPWEKLRRTEKKVGRT